MKILVTGANGQLGRKIKDCSQKFPLFEFEFTDMETLDICSENDVLDALMQKKPDLLINCAAYTAVDKAEDDVDNAFKVNAKAPQILAQACNSANCNFIHVSTDYVFDGTSDTPYDEECEVNPVSVYGASKLEGERNVISIFPNSIIIRTSWLYSEYGNNFVKTIYRLAKEKDFLNVVNDQFGTPTYAGDLACSIMQICLLYIEEKVWKPGIYHFSNLGECSWYDFASEILRLKGIKTPIKPVSSEQFPSKVKRPKYSVLSKAKILKEYKLKIPRWEESLALVIDKFE